MDVVVLVSGRGSNLRAIVRAIDEGRCRVRVAAVVADRRSAEDTETIIANLKATGTKVILALNKIDGMRRDTLLGLSQKLFESRIWHALKHMDLTRTIHVEAESKRIGRLRVPEALIARMWSSPCIRVDADTQMSSIPGLFAAGECASGINGANRLGGNSLSDLIVFGKRAGKRMAAACAATAAPKRVARAEDAARSELLDLSTRPDGVRPAEIRRALANLMMEKVGVYRDEALLASAVAEIRALKEEYQKVRVEDSGSVFNTDLLEARELGYLLDASEATAVSALARRESRGAHSREDFPERDDAKFLAHTMVWRGVEQAPATRIEYKPVTITTFEPKPRVY